MELELGVEAVGLGELTEGRPPSRLGLRAVANVAIFIPRLVVVLAGMNRVVWLLAAGIAMRSGWLVEQHPVVSCVPVEYSWRASERFSWRLRISSRAREKSRERMSESERTVRGIFTLPRLDVQ